VAEFKVVIPAAGGGTRLRPHTYVVPKVLLEVAGKPIIGHIVDRVLRAGPLEVCVVVGDSGEEIEAYLRGAFDCRFRFVHQAEPLGLGHAVYQARVCFDGEPALVLLGDTIVEASLSAMLGDKNVIGVKEVEDPRRFGVVEYEGGRVLRVIEKPEVPPSNLAVVGVYFIKDTNALFQSLGRMITQGRQTRGEFQLTDALQMMIEQGVPFETVPVDDWLDCGTPDALLATNRHLLATSGQWVPRDGVVVVPPVFIHDGAVVEHSVVGPDVSIGDGARVTGSVVRDSIIGRGAVVDRSVLERSILGERAEVSDAPRRLNLGAFSCVQNEG